ncbi:MAG TPA: hypothetical protein VM008_09730 [Phycisphaerae bacterium]|nr:hypothetical protein [Phycisphaerae bacterium]
MSNVAQVEKCVNCHRIIGAMETPMLWVGNVVCPGCYQALRNPAGTVGTRSPVKPVIPLAPRQTYRARVGKRSYILQLALFVWTVMVWGGLSAIVFFGIIAGASNPQPFPPPDRFATSIVAMGLAYVLMVTFWAWMIVALPLFIAAVVTLRTEEKQISPPGLAGGR